MTVDARLANDNRDVHSAETGYRAYGQTVDHIDVATFSLTLFEKSLILLEN